MLFLLEVTTLNFQSGSLIDCQRLFLYLDLSNIFFRVKELKDDKLSRWMAVIEFLIIYYLFLFGESKDFSA
jgi:hypothetical protein